MLLQKQQRYRLANYIAAADNDDVLSFELDPVMGQRSHTGPRRTRSPAAASQKDFADALGIEAVHVFARGNDRTNSIAVDMLRHRHHRQDTCNIAVMVESFDHGNDLILGRCFRQLQHLGLTAQTFDQLDQPVLINMRSRVIADYNDRQRHLDAFGPGGRDLS